MLILIFLKKNEVVFCFNHFLFTPLTRRWCPLDSLGEGKQWHLSLDRWTDRCLLVTYPLRPRKEGSASFAGLAKVALGSGGSNPGLWRVGWPPGLHD